MHSPIQTDDEEEGKIINLHRSWKSVEMPVSHAVSKGIGMIKGKELIPWNHGCRELKQRHVVPDKSKKWQARACRSSAMKAVQFPGASEIGSVD
ncbi:MAG: hypothetical protein ACLR2O_12515 [Coprococcus sp.]